MFQTYDWGSLMIQDVAAVRSGKSGTKHIGFGSQTYYQLAVKFSGKTIMSYASREYEFGVDDVVYIPKERRADVPYTRHFIAQGDGICIFFDSLYPLCDSFCVFHCGETVKSAFVLLNQIYNNPFKNSSVDCMQAFYHLLCLLRDELNNKKPNMESVERYIQEHFCDPYIDIQTLATIDGTSKEYFRQKFRENFGMPPLKYISSLKAQYARVLLCDSQYSVQEIAQMVGFTDANYFARFFKKHVGMSPTVYKERFI